MKKIEVSILRIIAMLMVVIYHCYYQFAVGYPMCVNQFVKIDFYGHLDKFLNSIDMPMFVFISGFLFSYLKYRMNKYSDGKAFVIKKTKRLLIPYLIWVMVTGLLVCREINLSDFYYSVCHLWFLLMLMWCFVLAYVCRPILEKGSLITNLLFCLTFSSIYFILVHFNCLTEVLCINSVLIYFPIFYLGIIWAKFSLDEQLSKCINKTLSLGMTLIFVVSVWMLTSNTFPLHSDLLARVSGVCLTLFLFQFLSSCSELKSKTLPSCIASVDQCSMGIYILHQIIIILLLNESHIAAFVNENVVIGPVLIFVVTFSLSWIVTAIVNKTKLKFIFG